MTTSNEHSNTHFLEVLEARSNVFRIIYDTIIEVDNTTEAETYTVLCRNLRRICDADYCAFASYDSHSKIMTLRTIEEKNKDAIESIAETIVLNPEFESLFKKTQIQACSDPNSESCLINMFPSLISINKEEELFYVSCVRDETLLAIGVIQISSKHNLKMKDLIEVYLNMTGMIIQRVNALNGLKTVNDELALRVEERTRELQLSNIQLHAEVVERKRAESELQESYLRLQSLFEQTIQGLASALEILDPYTAGHQRRVADIAVKIATELKLPQDKIDGLYMAASVHDIGKISIPAQILSKPGKLLAEEFTLIKTHSQAGYNVLDRIKFPWPVAKIVIQHHEQCDGSGYPNSLSADDILLESKIITVADVYEAMTSHRPYRPSLGTDKAIKTIIDKRGVGFDKNVVDAFLKLFYDGKLDLS